MSVPRFNSYNASGTDWLGELPPNWDVLLGRRLFQQIREAAREDDEQLSATQRYGVVPQKLFMELEDQKVVLALGGLGNFKHVEKDDFVISLRSFQGGIEHSAYSGCVSPAYTVLRARNEISASYYAYTFKSSAFVSALQTTTDGIRDGKNISYDQFGGVSLPLPPLPEQTAIATFLDRETAKIDALVQEQRRLIDLLKEKRQAVISRAVTKGLNPDAPMKDTGIEWLGEVPEHWDVARLKHISEVRGRIGFRGYTADDLVAEGEGALALGGANLSDSGRLSLDNRTYLSWEKYEESPEIKIQTGDVLIGQRGTCGRSVVIDRDIGPATINPSLVVLKELRLHPQFVTYWLMGDFSQKTFDSYLQKTAVPMLSQQQIGNLPISFPELEEQQQICMLIDRKLKEFHDLLKSCQAGIVLLEERRAALISAAVTGKIDVRDQHHCVEAAGS